MEDYYEWEEVKKMPMHKGHSKEVIAKNIKEMEKAGHPHKVAVAASMHKAEMHKGKK